LSSFSGSNRRHCPTAVPLGAIQCHVGGLQQHIRISSVAGREGDPDARAEQNSVSRDVTGRAHRADDALGQARGVARVTRATLK
jgi:hypothetical protein